jgi:hypothetical protein
MARSPLDPNFDFKPGRTSTPRPALDGTGFEFICANGEKIYADSRERIWKDYRIAKKMNNGR